MVLTAIPLALNLLTGIAVWTSELSWVIKVVITIILAAKVGIYFYMGLMEASGRAKTIGLIVSVFTNVLLVAFFIWKAVWTAISGCALLAILAIIWGSLSRSSFDED